MRLSEQLAEATLTDWESFLFEGTRYPVGTVRDWKRGGKTVKMKKVGHKEWVPVAKVEKEAVHEMASAEAKLTSLYGKKTAVIDGKELELDPELTSKTLDEHLSIAKDFLGKHDTVLAENLDMLKDLFPEAQVYGRVKTVASALTKLVRKPSHFVSAQESLGAWGDLLAEAEGARKKKGYATARDLDDGGGMRAVFKTVQEVEAAVKKLKAQFGKQCSSKQDEGPCIVSEDDYLGDSNPPNKNYPYRSYHLVIRRKGLNQEVQLRTKNQDRWGDWYHDAYKPRTPEQKAFFEANKPMVNDYARDVSDYFKMVESGKKATKPKCPDAIRKMFGCL